MYSLCYWNTCVMTLKSESSLKVKNNQRAFNYKFTYYRSIKPPHIFVLNTMHLFAFDCIDIFTYEDEVIL